MLFLPVVASGRVYALVLLGWSFAKTLLRGMTAKRPALVRFRERYSADRLSTLSLAERQVFPEFSSCIACERCELGSQDQPASAILPYDAGVMQMVMASTRSIADFDAAFFRGLATEPTRLPGLTEKCPASVPFVKLHDFVIGRVNEDNEDASHRAVGLLPANVPSH